MDSIRSSTSADARPGAASPLRRLAPLLLLLGLALAGCERNRPGSSLIPTGLRPRPGEGTAAIAGRIVYDPTNAPDLVAPPYPPTVVELWSAGVRVLSDTLARDTRVFRFDRLLPGAYTVIAYSRLFPASSLPALTVVDREIDAGDLFMPIDPSKVASSMQLLGDLNGYAFDVSSYMGLSELGLWLGPSIIGIDGQGNEVPGDTTLALAPGTYSFRFYSNGDLSGSSGYGGDGTTTWDVPVQDAPVRVLGATGHDLRIRITASGRYRFFVDERRETFSVTKVPGTAASTARRPTR